MIRKIKNIIWYLKNPLRNIPLGYFIFTCSEKCDYAFRCPILGHSPDTMGGLKCMYCGLWKKFYAFECYHIPKHKK